MRMRVFFKESVNIPGIQHALQVERDDLSLTNHGVVVPFEVEDKENPRGPRIAMEALVPWGNVKNLTRRKSEK